MKTFTLSCLVAVLQQSVQGKIDRSEARGLEKQFLGFAATQNKHYESMKEHKHRFHIWSKNHAIVLKMNEEHDGVLFADNFTSDMSDAEFAQMTGAVMPADEAAGQWDLRDAEDGRRHLNSAINWVTLGKVHPVKNQGQCGSCWAFAAVLVQESMQAIKDGTSPVRLSEQECVDCAEDAFGCQGGWMDYCWKWSKSHGMESDEDYPYTGVDDLGCSHDASNSISHADDWGWVDAPDTLTWLQNGPLSIAVAAGNDCWRYYSDGVLSSADRCPTRIDHAVNIVGYEPSQTIQSKRLRCNWLNDSQYLEGGDQCLEDYEEEWCFYNYCFYYCCFWEWTEQTEVPVWLIQNSWGTGWGESGFIRLRAEGGVGVSGMNQYIQWVTVK